MLAMIYFLVCFALSHAARRLERGGQLRTGVLRAA
jgi:ABC-type amino acid transport system permease subunit